MCRYTKTGKIQYCVCVSVCQAEGMTQLNPLLKCILLARLEFNTHILFKLQMAFLKCNITKRLDSSSAVSGVILCLKVFTQVPTDGHTVGHVLLNTLLWGLNVQILRAD